MAGRAQPAGRAALALALAAALAALLFWWNPAGLYLWVKAAHVVAIIAWMAGMLYLPRLFVYHCDVPIGSPQSETFKLMERRLLRFIINPAMTAAWVLGLWLAFEGGFLRSGWLHGKLVLVIAMSGLHGHFSAAVRAFAEDRNTRSARYWRIMNEAPTLLMIGIVILVIVKPF
jgi:protoporphyrinogen IX oxidase